MQESAGYSHEHVVLARSAKAVSMLVEMAIIDGNAERSLSPIAEALDAHCGSLCPLSFTLLCESRMQESKETRSETMETKAECRENSKNGEVSSDTKTF